MADTKQLSKLPPKESHALLLAESSKSKATLDKLILGCFAVQKLYGRDLGNAEHVTDLFHRLLGHYPAEKVLLSFERWLKTSQEFPTPADIIGLIRRNGRPPIRESDIIAIRKKDGEDRTREDWALLREWEKQQQDEWETDFQDEPRDLETRQENQRLRQRMKELEAENAQAWAEVRRLRHFENISVKVAEGDELEKVKRTILAMKREGAKQEDIEAFAGMYAFDLETLEAA